jgi:putative transcriptional regulator
VVILRKEVDFMVTKLKVRRIEKGLKQKELADKVGITAQYLYFLESGRSKNPSVSVMKRLAAVLDDSVEDLFFTEEGR